MIRLCAHASLYRLRSDFIDVMLCHEYDIKDPSIYLEAFELLKKSGEIREYGISTDDLEVLKRFNQNGNCAVVELDYSLINRKAEEGLLQYCMENNIAVLVRGPLAKGLLSGRYTKDHIFSDSVRKAYNEGELRNQFIEKIEKVDKVREVLDEDDNMADIALRYIISHESAPVAIPGAKSPEQAEKNANSGRALLDEQKLKRLRALSL
jgi:aryl-alcohol dehydrogenase-like predicted oxidoreductase